MKDFYRLFVNELKDVYNAEQQIIKVLPELAKASHDPKLKEAFNEHLKETNLQIERLKMISIELNEDLTGTTCDAMHGLLKEGHKIMSASYDSDTKDAALIGAAQRVEHYEMAVYGTLKTYAQHLKLEKIEKLLCDTLQEEGEANKKLTAIAEGSFFSSGINKKAYKRSA